MRTAKTKQVEKHASRYHGPKYSTATLVEAESLAVEFGERVRLGELVTGLRNKLVDDPEGDWSSNDLLRARTRHARAQTLVMEFGTDCRLEMVGMMGEEDGEIITPEWVDDADAEFEHATCQQEAGQLVTRTRAAA